MVLKVLRGRCDLVAAAARAGPGSAHLVPESADFLEHFVHVAEPAGIVVVAQRLSDAIRYLDRRLDKVNYGTYRAQDLEVGTGQVEGAIKYVIAKRCDHGGMRWIRQRAQAVIQLRCVDVNGHWHEFVRWALARLRTAALAEGRRARLQTNTPANLPQVAHAA